MLIMPGRESVELIMTHKSKVIDTQATDRRLRSNEGAERTRRSATAGRQVGTERS